MYCVLEENIYTVVYIYAIYLSKSYDADIMSIYHGRTRLLRLLGVFLNPTNWLC